MAITQSTRWRDVIFEAGRTFFHQKVHEMRDARAKHRVYRKTYHELSALSDRDLADLGIRRSMIKRLALEAAYGG